MSFKVSYSQSTMDSQGPDEGRARNGISKVPSSGGRRGSLYANLQLPTTNLTRPVIPQGDDHNENTNVPNYNETDYFPSDVVQNVLNSVKDKAHASHNVFCQLDTLKSYAGNWEWRETARWVKFEEVVEEGGKRWSKPHVASLSMYSMLQTRKLLLEGGLMLDLDVYTMGELTDALLDHWIDEGHLDSKLRQYMRDILLRKHKHSHQPRPKEEKRAARELHGVASVASMTSMSSHGSVSDLEGLVSQDYKPNSAFMRKIPKGSEVCNAMVGETAELESPIMILIRLKEARLLEGISEVKLPTRFVVCVFGPTGFNCREVGRCIATMMTDDVFREVAYKCRNISDLVAGLDEFVEQVTVLPPSEWNPKIRIEPPSKVQSQMHRTMSAAQLIESGHHDDDDATGHGDDPTLAMSKIPFHGLVQDVKRKLPWYWSDYKDGIHIQCLAAFVYVFLGTFTPNVTFGGLLGQATDQYMGVMECIFAAAITGVLFALFSGQPLNILGSTGPMLVLEMIIYNLCKDNGWDFLPARCWIGFWTAAMILVIVVFNLSALVKYITRFTEESFATLIAIIFIVEAFKKLFEIESKYPINTNPDVPIPTDCECIAPNCSVIFSATMATVTTGATDIGKNLTEICNNITKIELSMNGSIDWLSLNADNCEKYGGDAIGAGCHPPKFVADVFFFSILLFLGTFGLAVVLKDFKLTTIFPTFIRQLISDFAVLLSIIIFVVIDILVGIGTPKLLVPNKFQPTRADRGGWLVNPFSDKNPWWIALAAALPAILSVILIFLDQQITAVIVNRKENKLQKGVGYHLDMLVVAVTVAIHSVLGLPWYVAATVSALAHINSLKRESECTAPGEKPQFLGCRENRVTALAIGILSGAAVFITNVLKVIPMPVLYGVFFYMGYSAMRGMQFVDRLYLFVQPIKYQPDLPFLRHVQLYRVHIFTVIQILCLGFLWAVKSIKLISIAFPLMVLATGVVRKMMEIYFTQFELKWLDDLLPGKHAENPSNKEKPVGKINLAYDDPPAYKANGIGDGDKKKPVFFVAENEKDANKVNNATSRL